MVVGGIDRRVHHTRKPGHRSGDTKHNRKALIDINAEQTDGFAIGHTGAHHHAKCRKLKKREHRSDNHHGEQKVDDSPVRIHHLPGVKTHELAEIKRADERIRCRHRNLVGAEIGLDDLLQNDRKAKGNEDLVGVRTLVEVLDQPAFHNKADQQHDRDGK